MWGAVITKNAHCWVSNYNTLKQVWANTQCWLLSASRGCVAPPMITMLSCMPRCSICLLTIKQILPFIFADNNDNVSPIFQRWSNDCCGFVCLCLFVICWTSPAAFLQCFIITLLHTIKWHWCCDKHFLVCWYVTENGWETVICL